MRTALVVLALLAAATPLSAAIPQSQRDALQAVYNSTGGNSWTNKTNWNGAPGTECTWYGVSCDFEQANVDGLELNENNLTGTLPPAIGNFPKLLFLFVYSNPGLGGPLPPEIAQLSELSLFYASNASFTGRIPARWGALKNVKGIAIAGNQLEGPLPAELGDMTSLEDLDLYGNGIGGQLPAELGKLQNLRSLSLTGNRLEGKIPADLGRAAKLGFIGLSDNRFTGEIPAQLGDLSELTQLYLSGNELTGNIPASFARLKKLEILNLYNNHLSGPLPKEIGELSALKELTLNANDLGGALPAQLFNLGALEQLDLGDNELEGSISSDIGKLASLVRLALYDNHFKGEIPASLGSIATLEDLHLGYNELTGTIPADLSRLAHLRKLHLESNQLAGAIPRQLGELRALEELALFRNQLQGSIPAELGQLASLTQLNVSENQLTGTIPDSLRNLKQLQEFHVAENRLGGAFPPWIGELTKLGGIFFGGNEFTGTIPAGVGQLTELVYFEVGANQLTGGLFDFSKMGNLYYLRLEQNRLSGPIPTSVSALTNLSYADFGHNAFTGPLPRGIGNWTKAEYVSFADNQLEGELPAEIGGLRSAYNLSLHSNRFRGAIPKEIGQLTGLQYLGLSFNALRGEIPSQIRNLTNLFDASSDFSYNALLATDPATRAFILKKQDGNGFLETQTVTPENVRVTQTTDRSATLQWTPIAYNYNEGGYQVAVSTSPNGTPVAYATTRTKEIDTITVRNLDPQRAYFFTVSAVTHPHDPQQNLLVSDPSPARQAATGQRVVSPAEIEITEFPDGLVQIDGKPAADDQFTLTNFGDVATQLTLQLGGDSDFFTASPQQFAIPAGGSQVIVLRSKPQQPAGTQYGNVVPQGPGVPEGMYVDVILLSQARPAGTVIATPVEPRIELRGKAGSDEIGVAEFRNSGTAPLTGIVLSDQPWIVPRKEPITIPPGQKGGVNFTVMRSRRPAGEGALVANLSLVYVDGTLGLGSLIELGASSSGVSISKVTVVDVTTPSATTGTIPPLAPGEIPLIVAGVVNRTNTRSDLSLLNAAGASSIGDLKLYYTSGPATSVATLLPLPAAQAVSFTNILGNIYNASNSAGTLQIRSADWDSLGADAKVTAVRSDGGTLAGGVPVFRGDRGIRGGERLYLTGLSKPADLVIQELGGVPSNVFIEFLNAAGNAVGSSLTQPVAARSLVELRDAVPAGAVTAILSNTTASSTIIAYARVGDASGDNWSVVDWSGFYRYAREAAVRVPFADGRTSTGGGGKRRSVAHAVAPAPRTDLTIFNTTTAQARARVETISASGSISEREVVLGPRATSTLIDAGGVAGSTSAHLVVTPLEGALAVTARSHAFSSGGDVGTAIPVLSATAGLRLGQSQTFARLEDSTSGTVAAATPATYRTSYGLVETTGVAATVRARIVIGDAHALVSASTTRTFNLAPRQQIVLPELLRSFAGDARDTLYGDLHDVSLELEVTEGNGSVVPFVIVIDNGTGDSVLRVQ